MPAGPYQSRSLSFLTRQSRKLADRFGLTLRQLKTAATWGAQIVLYPIYLAFQTGRLIGKQLQQELRKPWPLFGERQEEPPSLPVADQAVLEVLDAIPALFSADLMPTLPGAEAPSLPSQVQPRFWESLQSASGQIILIPTQQDLDGQSLGCGTIVAAQPTHLATSGAGNLTITNSGSTSLEESPARAAMTTATPVAIQGVASLVTTRRLVLVTVQNQVLDILSSAQQRQLYDRIVWAMANYYYRLRSLRLQQQSFDFSLPLPVDRPQMIGVVRSFRKLMGWVQQGPVATTLDLFRESGLLAQSEEPIETAPRMRQLPPSRSFVPRLPQILKRTGQTLRAVINLDAPLTTATESLPAPTKPPQAEPLSWKSFDALPYIPPLPSLPAVSKRNAEDSATVEPTPAEPPSIQIPPRRRNWLNWSDLFARPKIESIEDWPEPSAAALVRAQSANLSVPVSEPEAVLEQASEVESDLMIGGQPSPRSVAPPQLAASAQPADASPLFARADGAADMSTTWIEIEAEPVGYIKHPLEQVLGWLDYCFLKVEQFMAAIVQRLRAFLGKLND